MENFFSEKEEDNFHDKGGETGGNESKYLGGDFFGAFCLAMEDPFAVGKVGNSYSGNPGYNRRGVIFKMENIEAEMVDCKIRNGGDDTPKNIGDNI